MAEINLNVIRDQSEKSDSAQTLLDCIDELRKTLNIHEVCGYYSKLLQPNNGFIRLCAALDALRDSQRAIDRYKTIETVNHISGDSLFLYGILNALYIQQDAIRTWGELIGEKIDFQYFPDTFRVRVIRDDICHSSERRMKEGVSKYQIFISPTSCEQYSFDYLRFETATATQETIKVDLKKCIDDQERDITLIIKNFTAKIYSTVNNIS